jgi:hypothetical protein
VTALAVNPKDSRLEVDKRHQKVVLLREAGISWRRISRLTSLSSTTCQKIWKKHIEQAFECMDVQEHRARILADFDGLLDVLRPWAFGRPIPEGTPHPNMRRVKSMLRVLNAQAKLIGANTPGRTQIAVVQVRSEREETNEREKAEHIKELAKWACENRVIRVEDCNPPLASANGANASEWSYPELGYQLGEVDHDEVEAEPSQRSDHWLGDEPDWTLAEDDSGIDAEVGMVTTDSERVDDRSAHRPWTFAEGAFEV